ncbi:MAG: hypothetical protein ACE5FU_13215 [Nitrospinota bacterium]
MEIFKREFVRRVQAGVLLCLLSACGNGGNIDSSSLDATNQTGGVAVQLKWKKSKPGLLKVSDDCVQHDVATVSITVLVPDGTSLGSGSFSCQNGQGEVTGIPIRGNLVVRVELKDSKGNVRSVAEKGGVNVGGGASTVVQIDIPEPNGRWGFMKWGSNTWGT